MLPQYKTQYGENLLYLLIGLVFVVIFSPIILAYVVYTSLKA